MELTKGQKSAINYLAVTGNLNSYSKHGVHIAPYAASHARKSPSCEICGKDPSSIVKGLEAYLKCKWRDDG